MTLRALAGAAAVLGCLALAPVAMATPPDSLAAPPIPPPVGYVNDHAAVLDEPARAKLEGFLDQVQKKTGAEFAVLIVRSTEPLTPSEYKVKVFDQWKLGKKGQDNGLLMLVALDEREVRFETGYGLEGVLPDGLQSRIFREEMAPKFQAGDFAGGIQAGVVRTAAKIAADAGVTLEWDGRELRYDEPSRRIPPIGPAAIIFFVILVIVLSRLGGGGFGGPRRRGMMMGPFWGGFGGGLGGGFGGGFGGGGFGGGGFGGFGGGGSGGGGGGGRW